jgi:hypothetical protein
MRLRGWMIGELAALGAGCKLGNSANTLQKSLVKHEANFS